MLAFFLVFERVRIITCLGTPSVRHGWTRCTASSFIVYARRIA